MSEHATIPFTRRRFLLTSATGATATIAGCNGSGDYPKLSHAWLTVTETGDGGVTTYVVGYSPT